MRVRRGIVRDEFSEGGRTAVLVNNQVLVLSEIATVIYEATPSGQGTTLEDLTTAVLAEFGEPEPPLDATEATRDQVLDLVAHQVLVDGSAIAGHQLTAEGLDVLRDCLRHLVSDDPARWRLPDGMEGPFFGAVRHHRLAPALSMSLDRFDLPPEVSMHLLADCATARRSVSRQVHELHEMLEALEAAGVRTLVFKGLALAVQAHGHVDARGPGDHDLLVHPADLTRAHAALTSLGWAPSLGFARPGDSWAWRHLVRRYHELPLARGHGSADLHWHLGPVRAAFPSFDELWNRRAVVRLAGRDVPTLSPYDAFAHSASHAATDDWRSLRSLLDVHRLMSDPEVWRSADRPLRHDQLLTVGLTARLLGTPDGAPEVVTTAAGRASTVAREAQMRQSRVHAVELAERVPGVAFAHLFLGLGRAGARPGDFGREVSRYLLPVTDFSGDPTRQAIAAVPRALVRRGRQAGRMLTERTTTRLRSSSRTRESHHVRST